MKKIFSFVLALAIMLTSFGLVTTTHAAAGGNTVDSGKACEAHLNNIIRKNDHRVQMYFEGKITLQELFEAFGKNYEQYAKHCVN